MSGWCQYGVFLHFCAFPKFLRWTVCYSSAIFSRSFSPYLLAISWTCQAHSFYRTFALAIPSTWSPLPPDTCHLPPPHLQIFAEASPLWSRLLRPTPFKTQPGTSPTHPFPFPASFLSIALVPTWQLNISPLYLFIVCLHPLECKLHKNQIFVCSLLYPQDLD